MSTSTKRPVTRRGRWTYNSDSTRYGVAGWHLDGTPLVVDFMPDHGWDSKGEYQLYNDPCRHDHHSLDRYMAGAMRESEEHWDTLHGPEAEALRQPLAEDDQACGYQDPEG